MLWTEKRFRRYDEAIESFSDLLRYETDEEGNILLDARLAKIIEALGSNLAKSLKFSVLGSISGQARLEKGLKGAIAADIIDQQMPLLNLIGDFLGVNTKKYIAKHPEAMLQLAQHFMPMLLKTKFGSLQQNAAFNPAYKNPYGGEY